MKLVKVIQKEGLHDPNALVVVVFGLVPKPPVFPNPPVPPPKDPPPNADVVGFAPNKPPLVPVF
jgi:hypothetical protein